MSTTISTSLPLTHHARQRRHDRGIPPVVLNWLLDHGAEHYQHDGTVIRYFDKRARKLLDSIIGHEATSRMSKFLAAYAVTADDGYIVTTGFRYKRVWN